MQLSAGIFYVPNPRNPLPHKEADVEHLPPNTHTHSCWDSNASAIFGVICLTK